MNEVVNRSKQFADTLNSMPLSSMIGGPMLGAIDAQQHAAIKSMELIQEFCMEPVDKDKPDGPRKLTEVMFTYKKPNGDDIVIQIPLLFLVPIPFIKVESINIGFTMKMNQSATSSHTKEKSQKTKRAYSVSAGGAGPGFMVSASFSGSFSSSYKNKSHSENKYNTEMNFDVSVQAVQDDMPGGMKKVFEMLESSISPQTIPAPAEVTPVGGAAAQNDQDAGDD